MEDKTEGQESLRPHKTWFIERGDGFIFAAREEEAWALFKNRTNWMRRDFKIIGVSDGTTYHKVLRENQNKVPTIQNEINKIQQEIADYASTEHNLKFKELVDDTDERMQKIKKFKVALSKKLTTKMKELNNLTANASKLAFEAELNVARGNIEQPRNYDVIAPQGQDKQKLIKALGV